MHTAPSAASTPSTVADPAATVRPSRALLLAIPVLITLHNAEESATFDQGLGYLGARFPERAGALPSLDAVYLALAVATLVPWLVWLGSRLTRERSPWVALLLFIQSLMLYNVVWHLLAAGALGGVAPGLLTAVTLNLPFSLFLLHRAWNEQWVRRSTLKRALAAACIVHLVPVLALLWLLTRPSSPLP